MSMKQKKKSKSKQTPTQKKPGRKTTKKKTKKAITAKDNNVVSKVANKPAMAKNTKSLDSVLFEKKERQYKFDERLVPYYLGGDTKEGNLALRVALIKLGKTPEITELFVAMKAGNLGYRDDAKEVFIKALYAVIKGHDEIGLAHVYEEDIQAIHNNNLKTFNEFWEAMAKSANEDDDFVGFSN
jgi:hypothetical protein